MKDKAWIIFDLGGVLIPPTDDCVKDAVSRRLGIPVTRLREAVQEYRRPVTSGALTLAEMYARLVRELAADVTARELLEQHLAAYRSIGTAHNRQVVRIIESLKSHVGVACFTNTEIEIAEISRRTGLFNYFDRAYISTELGMQKPDRESYRAVLADLGCQPADTVFIDDQPPNVAAAEAIGMHGILFQDASQLERDLHGTVPSRGRDTDA